MLLHGYVETFGFGRVEQGHRVAVYDGLHDVRVVHGFRAVQRVEAMRSSARRSDVEPERPKLPRMALSLVGCRGGPQANPNDVRRNRPPADNEGATTLA